MSCRDGLGEINNKKSKIRNMVTQGKNFSCMFEAQKLQMLSREDGAWAHKTGHWMSANCLLAVGSWKK